MRKHHVKHSNLRRYLEEFEFDGSDLEEKTFELIISELKHSNLIVAGEVHEKLEGIATFENGSRMYGFLFTDMDEFRKFAPNGECGCETFDFEFYKRLVDIGDVDGFVLNPSSEGFVIVREVFEAIKLLPNHEFEPENPYTPDELKTLRDSMDNVRLEDFIADSSNIARYEELFKMISKTTLLTLMVSRNDLSEMAENGIIEMENTGPLGFLYLDDVGGHYATVYTSEVKMKSISTDLYKYSQVVNFSQLTNYVLNDDLDGIVINPNTENIVLTREVLLEYWPFVEDLCNDSRLNTAIMNMFLIKEEI